MNKTIKIGLIVFGNMFLMGLLLVSIAIYTRFEGTFMFYLLRLIGTIIAVYFVVSRNLSQIASLSKR